MDKNPQPPALDQAVALYQQGKFQEALKAARQGLAKRPAHVGLLNVAAAAAIGLRRFADAERYWRTAIAARPDAAEVHANLGSLLLSLGRQDEAEATLRQALALRPDQATVHYQLGTLLESRGQWSEAEAAYRQVLRVNPRHAEALNNLGNLLQGRACLDEAEAAYRQAVELRPSFAEAHNNLGNMLRGRGRPAQAEEALRRALVIRPSFAEAHNNLAILLHAQGRWAEAEAAYRQALALRPGYAEARWNFGQLLLLTGHFAEGWSHYEVRYAPEMGERVVRSPTFPLPCWHGEALAGKALLLRPEQGFGDQIQFCRYVPLLKKHGAKRVDIQCDPRLAHLFATLADVDAIVPTTQAVATERYDYWVLPLSIPHHLNTTLDTIPAELPYLYALPERIAWWREHLPRAGLRVGLVWKGRATHINDANRSLPGLRTLVPLWSVPGVTFVSLQKGAGEDEAAAPPADQPLVHLGSAIADFADTAAIVSQLDLVICVDTASAHLAGALGRPCWVLLPALGSDWRWLLERTDSPWYPGVMRLFRQETAGDWAGVVARMAKHLREVCAMHACEASS